MIVNYSYCQQNYKPGYILNNNNDTLHVELQEEILSDLMLKVKYKNTVHSSEISTANPGEIKGFGYTNGSLYKSVRFLDNPIDSTSIKSYFVEQLLSGVYDLFLYQKADQQVYIILNEGHQYLLTNTTYTGRGEVKEQGQYQNQLLFLAVQCEALKKDIDLIKFDEQSIMQFVTQLNKCTNPNKAVINYYHKAKSKFEIMAFAGAFPVISSLQATAEIMVRLSYPKLARNVYINVGLHYSQTPSVGTGYSYGNFVYQYKTKDVIFSLPVLVQYNITSGRVQPYIGAGFSIMKWDQTYTYYRGTINNNQISVEVIAEVGIEATLMKNLLIKAAWRYEKLVQYPAIGIAVKF